MAHERSGSGVHEHRHGEPDHAHPPEETRSAEPLPPPSREGSVVVDIGPGVGAAVIRTTPDMAGAEIERRLVGDEWHGVHTAVRERQAPGGSQYAALFGSLPVGRYELRIKADIDPRPRSTIDVVAGTVVTAIWPEGGADVGSARLPS